MAEQPEVTIDDVIDYLRASGLPAKKAMTALQVAFSGEARNSQLKALAAKRGLAEEYKTLFDIELENGFVLVARTINKQTAYYLRRESNEAVGSHGEILRQLASWGLKLDVVQVPEFNSEPAYEAYSASVRDVLNFLNKSQLPFTNRNPEIMRASGIMEYMRSKTAAGTEPSAPVVTTTTA